MIHAEALYCVQEIKNYLPFTDHSLRKARKAGLKVTYFSLHGYIIGRDLINFIEAQHGIERVQIKSQETKE